MFKLWYNCRNGGDGSVSVNFHQDENDALEADEKDIENGCDGWGEDSADYVELKVIDNSLYFKSGEFIDGEYQYVWNLVGG